MVMYDIVYFVKESKTNEELRYSLRTLKNFPHRKVWFYGGCPEGLKPDQYVYVEQDQPTKWLSLCLLASAHGYRSSEHHTPY